MIPKTIHYCWFGRGEMSPFIKQCIATWRKVMPDYELKLWNEDTFDVNSVPFVKEAYESKKYAFVSDYVRLYALYTEGGVYLDTDVRVFKSFDEFLSYSFFTSQESHPELVQDGMFDEHGNRLCDKVSGIGLHSAILAVEKGHSFFKGCLDYYATLSFDLECKEEYIIVNIITRLIEEYGYKYTLERQYIERYNFMIFEPAIFSTTTTFDQDKTYAIHLFNGSWTDSAGSFKNRMRNKYPWLYEVIKSIIK